jgi:ubiquitin related modifier 1
LEMLFSNQKRHALSIPATKEDGKPANIAFLVDYLVKNLMKDPRKELFVLDKQVYVCPHVSL